MEDGQGVPVEAGGRGVCSSRGTATPADGIEAGGAMFLAIGSESEVFLADGSRGGVFCSFPDGWLRKGKKGSWGLKDDLGLGSFLVVMGL